MYLLMECFLMMYIWKIPKSKWNIKSVFGQGWLHCINILFFLLVYGESILAELSIVNTGACYKDTPWPIKCV